MLTFQQIIHRLTQFWEQKQCVIHQGHDLEVGAGTFNPATFLRALGPEPYRTAYVEPSRRPSDGRYGENPNRIQLFHQFQVILKPSPADVQKMYLESLEALDFDLSKHDIRFVHDDWESPTLGAWGLGWEVWCDGMEVTQFTYFQSVGSVPLHPISVELTYGLERLAMFIQNKDSIFDVQWNEELTIGDISHRSEVEWSAYNFTEASTEMWMRHFEDYEQEAKHLIARHLPLPAYDFVIKASHAFNLLDARGVISVTERTGYISRIRELARLIAVEYAASREQLGFPLLTVKKEKAVKKSAAVKSAPKFNPKKTQDFLLEIGSEQLPATFIPIGCVNLEKAMRRVLDDEGLQFESLKTYGTPQRLSILIQGLVEGTEDKIIERKGPPLTTCFNTDGQLTPQGEGFFKSLSLKPVSLNNVRSGKAKGLRIEKIKDTEYLFASLPQKGKSTYCLLSEALPKLILNLDFPKKMRWGDLDISYARPIHWIVALLGDKVIPFEVGTIHSNRISYGHAQLKPVKFSLKSPKDYLAALRKHFVLADIEERKQSILSQLAKLEKKLNAKTLEHAKVLPQVLHLVEWPQLTVADFDKKFLKAPQEVLISEMVEHQKYFPVADRKGNLLNQFIITADNTPTALIRKGNQKVLSARLSDGVFLFTQDQAEPLEKFNEKLKVMTYQKELGSMLDKVERIVSLAQLVNQHLELADPSTVSRAALLCKADLASALVGEFPELQGTIGKYYALAQKEPREIASAIEEHWMPRAEGAPLPQTPTGIVLSLADKLDNLIGCYSVGLKPTSSSDPYALRRQTIGLIKMLIDAKRGIDLKQIFMEGCQVFPKLKNNPTLIATTVAEMLSFITARAKNLFEDFGFKKDEVEASLQTMCTDPYDQYCKTKALHAFRKSGTQFAKLVEVYKRAKGQLSQAATTTFNRSLAEEPAERELIRVLDLVEKQWPQMLAEKQYVKAFELMATLQLPLAHLFDQVKILCDDPAIRANRIALLHKVFSFFKELVDFHHIQEGN